MKKKGLALVLALALLAIGIVAGSLAWLTAKSDVVVNTFTASDITVKLKETTGTEYKMIPGYEITKDPKAWVEDGSEDCYLFVKLEWANNTSDANKAYLTYQVADGWTALEGVSGVYYRTVTSAQMSKDHGETNAFPVLAGNKVTVSGDITKEQMNAFTKDNLPKLTITAYASQLHQNATADFTAAEAWSNLAA